MWKFFIPYDVLNRAKNRPGSGWHQLPCVGQATQGGLAPGDCRVVHLSNIILRYGPMSTTLRVKTRARRVKSSLHFTTSDLEVRTPCTFAHSHCRPPPQYRHLVSSLAGSCCRYFELIATFNNVVAATTPAAQFSVCHAASVYSPV